MLEKTHPSTLRIIMNVAISYEDGLNYFEKSEEMKRHALDGYEKSRGKEHDELCKELGRLT